MSEVKNLSFTKNPTGHIDLKDPQNIEQIEEFVLPIISQNEGWDTADLTTESFHNNTEKYQTEMDVTLFDNVHILMDNTYTPAALLTFQKEDLKQVENEARMDNLISLITHRQSTLWAELVKREVITPELLETEHQNLQDFFSHNDLYSEIGIVVRPDLQGKKTGLVEKAYKLMPRGIHFSWTSNPIIVRQRRKIFSNVIFFPLFSEHLSGVFGLASAAILYADLLTYEKERWEEKEFGALYSEFFVSHRGPKYLQLAQKMSPEGKITTNDVKRISYLISQNAVQGALFSLAS